MSPLLEQSRCWKHLGKSPVQVPLERVPSPLELRKAWAQGGSAPAQWEGKVGRVTALAPGQLSETTGQPPVASDASLGT